MKTFHAIVNGIFSRAAWMNWSKEDCIEEIEFELMLKIYPNGDF